MEEVCIFSLFFFDSFCFFLVLVFFDILFGIEYGFDRGICFSVVWLMYDLVYLESLFVVLLVWYMYMEVGELLVVYDCSNM